MDPTYQHTDSTDDSSSSSSSSEQTHRPLQLSFILQFSGASATTSRRDLLDLLEQQHHDSGASTSTGNELSGTNGASTSSRNGFSGLSGASTSTGNGASTSRENGFYEPTGNGFSGPTDESTSPRDGFSEPTDEPTSTGLRFSGPCGAAAMVLVKDAGDRDELAVVLHKFRQGLGNQTIRVAQYRGLILGLTESLRKGYTEIAVQGNSQLVIDQFLGDFEIDDPELRTLCDEALELRNSFQSFSINHIDQNLSRAVDDEAVRATSLAEGQVEEEP